MPAAAVDARNANRGGEREARLAAPVPGAYGPGGLADRRGRLHGR